MTQDRLNELLDSHEKWCRFEGGERADVSGEDLRNLDLSGRNLFALGCEGTDFRGAKLDMAKLVYVFAPGTRFDGASMQCTDFYQSNVSNSVFDGCDCTAADFSCANICNCIFNDAICDYINLTGTKMDNLDDMHMKRYSSQKKNYSTKENALEL